MTPAVFLKLALSVPDVTQGEHQGGAAPRQLLKAHPA